MTQVFQGIAADRQSFKMSASFTDKKFEEALELACRRYMSFENLHENLHQEQKVAMQKLLGGNDIFFSAPTGF